MNNEEVITLGGGCFWCLEAPYQELEGVLNVTSGYMGGKVKDPTYREVTYGRTGHAEVVQITFNPAVISPEKIFEVFWTIHDPTTLNRQGNDVGTQYRSVIFYHNEDQAELARRFIDSLNSSDVYENPIVTEVVPAAEFYPAEDYHQDYYLNNPSQPYCSFIVKPKVDKVRTVFQDLIKK